MQAYTNFHLGLIEDLIPIHNARVAEVKDAIDGMVRAGGSPVTRGMVDGVWLSPSVADLLKEVKDALARSMTRVKFLVLDSPPCDALALYREGDTFALCFIGRRLSTGKYYVSHPAIINEKFKPSRPDHYMVMSSGIPHIIKAVKKYCGPIQPSTVIETTSSLLLQSLSKAYRQARIELSDFNSKYLYSSRVLEEFANVLKGGTPSAEMAQAMERYDTLKVEASAERNAQFNLCFFMFSQLPSGTTLTQFKNFGTVKYKDTSESFARIMPPMGEDQRTYVTVEKLPDEVLAKVSTLSMLDNDTYLRGVGYKFRQNVFYVEMPIEVERAARIGTTL